MAYETSKIKLQGIDRATFDFDEEFKNGLTPEEFKAEIHKRIRRWWGDSLINSIVFRVFGSLTNILVFFDWNVAYDISDYFCYFIFIFDTNVFA